MKKILLFLVFTFSLTINSFANKQKIELKNLFFDVKIAGQVSQTEVLLEFYNPNSRVMEYELNIPFSQSQVITGFALDVDGAMIDAVPVEKSKARETFEDIVRRGVDPGLLEKTNGNNFKLRIYPINPGKTRKVRLAYTEILKSAEGKYRYELTGNLFGEKADKVTAQVSVSEVCPENYSFSFSHSQFRHNRNTNSYIATADGYNIALDSDIIQMTVPQVENNIAMASFDNENFFMCQMSAPQNAGFEDIFNIFQNESITIMWDASLSEKRHQEKYLTFLESFFGKIVNCKVDLIVFRDIEEEAEEFNVQSGDWALLRQYLQNVVYDGSASYDFLDREDEKSYKNVLLFSDGQDLFSIKSEIDRFAKKLFCITSGNGADLIRLSALADENSGKVIDLGEFVSMSDAVLSMSRIDETVIENTANTRDCFVQKNGDRIVIVGKVDDLSKNILLKLRDGKNFQMDLSNAFVLSSVPKIWANLKINDLNQKSYLHKAEIRRISKKYKVVTDESSLIVLENAQDYAKYDIEPPEIFKDEYDKILKGNNDMDVYYLNSFKYEWEEYVNWWKTDFSKDNPKQLNPTKLKNRSHSHSSEILYDLDSQFQPLVLTDLESPMAFREVSAGASNVLSVYDEQLSENRQIVSESMSKSMSKSMSDNDVLANGNLYNYIDENAVKLSRWNPDSDFANRINKAEMEDAYIIYLDEREDFIDSPEFYLDCSYALSEKGLMQLSRRVLSNLAEIAQGDRSVLKLLGNRLLQMDENDMAVNIFNQIMQIAPNEPQSYLDLGIAYERNGKYQEAVENLYKIVESTQMRNFPGIRLIAMKHINAIVFRVPGLDISFIDPYFIRNMPLDLRVSLSWDTDNTDIDLHVIDPNEEETYFAHRISYQGGLNSNDNTSGFGPEDYCLKSAKKGKYRVEAKFYSNRQQKLTYGTYIYLDFYLNWGTEKQIRKSTMMKLEDVWNKIYVGEIEV